MRSNVRKEGLQETRAELSFVGAFFLCGCLNMANDGELFVEWCLYRWMPR